MTVQEIYQKAYQLMDQAIIDGNCGELCGYHCCRDTYETGERMGMYLLPLEYEAMQKSISPEYDIHTYKDYDIPAKTKKLHYIYCHGSSSCLRDLRPIQCRTYPLEPHLINNQLQLVVEKDQIHACPLLEQEDTWRPAYIDGTYAAWELLMQIPQVRYYISKLSEERVLEDNVLRIVR